MAARVVVVGGGLAGLAAAALAARGGAEVTVFEGAGAVGGRAATRTRDGYAWNWGVHALYRKGPGAAVLRELGVRPDGAVIRGERDQRVLAGGRVLPAPFGLVTAFGPVLDGRDRRELVPLIARVSAARGAELAALPLAAWLDEHVARPRVRALLLAMVRLTTYAHDPARQSAGAALAQLRLALAGVWYLHGGWGRLAGALREAAAAAGATVRTDVRVRAVEHDAAVRGVRLADGTGVAADGVVVAAGGPRAAARLLDGPGSAVVAGWAEAAAPVRAATLELSLRRQPQGSTWLLGLDRPVYVNVQSRYARLAPPGAAVVHAVRYLGPDGSSDGHRRELEAALDLALPGWRSEVVDERFLPAITVAHDLPVAASGGLPGRPGPRVPGVEGLAVAGDWVGGRGLLAAAALASAREAAALVRRAAAPATAPA